MQAYQTEQEQLERIKDLWKQHGQKIMTAFVVLAILFWGWQWQQNRQIKQQEQAAVLFDNMLQAHAEGKFKETEVIAKTFTENYAKTAYADFAKFLLAKMAFAEGRYPVAQKNLQALAEKKFSDVAKIRMAKVLASDKQYKEALSLLKAITNKAYYAVVHELLGDIYLQQNQLQDAKVAYEVALSHERNRNPFLLLKIENLTSSIRTEEEK